MAGRAQTQRVRLVPPRGEPELEAGEHAGQQRQGLHALAALPAAAAAPRGEDRRQGRWSTASTSSSTTGSSDNKPGGPTSRYAWGPPIYEGFRSLVLVCAAAGPRGNAPWLLKALKQNGEMAARARRATRASTTRRCTSRWGSTRSPSRIGRPAWRQLAIAADRAPSPCGSSTRTARTRRARSTTRINNYRWFNQAAERMRRAGDPVPPELSRVDATPAFIAQATRPDGRVEALGDGFPSLLGPDVLAGHCRRVVVDRRGQRFRAQRHDDRVRRRLRLRPVAAGAARSGRWPTRPSTASAPGRATASRTRTTTPGSLTLYSHGSPLLLDTGQWEYLYGTTRSFVVSRAAHNAVLVDGVARSRGRGPSCAPAGSTGWTSPRSSTAATAAWPSPAPSRTTGSRTSWSSGTGCRRQGRCAPASSGASAATGRVPGRRRRAHHRPRRQRLDALHLRRRPAGPRRRQEVADARLEQRVVRRAVAGPVGAGDPEGELAVLADRHRAAGRGVAGLVGRRDVHGRCVGRRSVALSTPAGSSPRSTSTTTAGSRTAGHDDADRSAPAPVVLAGSRQPGAGRGLGARRAGDARVLAGRVRRPGRRSPRDAPPRPAPSTSPVTVPATADCRVVSGSAPPPSPVRS